MKSLTEKQAREVNGGWLIKWWNGRCKICGYQTGWTSEGSARYALNYHIQVRHRKIFTGWYSKFSTKYEWH